MSIREIIAAVFIIAGVFCCVACVVGIYRLPDFYARNHASGTAETGALLLTCIGFIILNGLNVFSVKIVVLFIFVCVCNPIGSHVLARSGYKNGFPMTLDPPPAETAEGKEAAENADSVD